MSKYLFVVNDLLKRKALGHYVFLLRFIIWEKHKWFDIRNAWVVAVTVNKRFFQSSSNEWIGHCKEWFQKLQKVVVSGSILQQEELFQKCKFLIVVMLKNLNSRNRCLITVSCIRLNRYIAQILCNKVVEKKLTVLFLLFKDKFKNVFHHWQNIHVCKFLKFYLEYLNS